MYESYILVFHPPTSNRQLCTGYIGMLFISHYENVPMQYTEIFKVVKNGNFQ